MEMLVVYTITCYRHYSIFLPKIFVFLPLTALVWDIASAREMVGRLSRRRD